MRWFGHLVRMPPRRLPGEVFRARPTGRRPQEDSEHAGGTRVLGTPWDLPGRAG